MWVVRAIAIMIARMVVITGKSLTKWSFVQRMRLNTTRRPTVRLAARNAATPRTVLVTDHASSVPDDARPKAMATIIQPIVSSKMADATIIWPRLRRMKFISRTTIATIFTDEIERAVPRKIEVMKRASGFGKIESGSNSV